MPFRKDLAVSRCSGERFWRRFSSPSAFALERCSCESSQLVSTKLGMTAHRCHAAQRRPRLENTMPV